MKIHGKNKTRMLQYIYSNAYTYLLNSYYIYITLYHMFYIVILFYISKASIDKKINKQQQQQKPNGTKPNHLD